MRRKENQEKFTMITPQTPLQVKKKKKICV